MATNRLFIYDKDSNTAVCIANGYSSGWGKISAPKASEKFFDDYVEEYPGKINTSKLQIKTEDELGKDCHCLYEPPSVTHSEREMLLEANAELEHVRELNRENVGRVKARDQIIKDLKDQINGLNQGYDNMVPPEVYLSMVQEKDLLQSQVSKLIDILHTKEKGYFD